MEIQLSERAVTWKVSWFLSLATEAKPRIDIHFKADQIFHDRKWKASEVR